MTDDKGQRGARRARASGAAVAIAIGLAAALYVTLAPQGNDLQAAECAATAEAAATLDPLIGGEVAAFQLATTADSIGDLTFQDEKGETRRIADVVDGVGLVNLWATWCAPCRQEMPALDRLQAAKGGADFQVVPISIDTGGREKPEAFLSSIDVRNLPLYTDPTTDIFDAMKQRSLALGLPVTVLVDGEGCRLGHMNGPAEWDRAEGQRLIEAAIDAVAVRGAGG